MAKGFEPLIKFIFFAVGIGGIVYSLFSMYLSKQAASWPTVIGLFNNCGIEETKDYDGDTMYEAKVAYSYEFSGRKYSGKRIGFGLLPTNMRFMVASAHKKATRSYPEARVKVNPKNPSLSTLLWGVHTYHIVTLAFFVVFFGIAYYALTKPSI